ncbi:MAG: SYNERG-CTERM sorting domain-containing protein [Synergistaceae bacterium]|nr:SYNERG-CTERM sorting domain-containing protein [Synergistaceae bacterium]
MISVLALLAPLPAAYATTGKGTASEPYIVITWSELDETIKSAASEDVMTYVELSKDIDAVSAATYATSRHVTINGKGHTLTATNGSFGNRANTGLRFDGTASGDDGNIIVLRNLTFKDFQVGGTGGATTARGGSYGYGGGALSVRSGIVTIENCAFINNESVGTGNNALGGAVFLQNNGVLNIINSTFFGNKSARAGGAIYAGNSNRAGDSVATGTIANCTIVGNTVTGDYKGGGLAKGVNSTVKLVNSIVVGNKVNTTSTTALNNDVDNFDDGYNLIGFSTNNSHNETSTIGVIMGDLFTATTPGTDGTLALKAKSPAIDAANSGFAPFADQRGFVRVAADIGAYEYGEGLLRVGDVKPIATGEELDNAIKTAVSGTVTALYLENDIDAVTSTTYGASSLHGTAATDGKWIFINGQGHTLDGKNGADTALRFGSNRTDDTRNRITLYNLTLQNLQSGKDADSDGESDGYRFGGGAVAVFAGELTIKNSAFKDNTSYGTTTGSANMGGGAIFMQNNARLDISNSSFSGNTTHRRGGAIHVNGSLTVANTSFVNNSADQLGGAIAFSTMPNSPIFNVDSSSSFTDNTAGWSGGAIHIYGTSGNNYFPTPIAATINATFKGNSDGIDGTETDDYVLSAHYPPTFTEEVTADPYDAKFGTLIVGENAWPATYFADANRSAVITPPIEVNSHEDLKKALGYWNYSISGTKDTAITEGIAEDGDIIVINSNLTYDTHSYNSSTTSKTDADTGATVFITKNVSIFGNGHIIDGNGYPVLDFDGGERTVVANLSNVVVKNGAYNAKPGGAVFVEGNATLNLNRVTFNNNTAGAGGGGAIYMDPHGTGLPMLNATDSIFNGNKAKGRNDVMGMGGAISARNGAVTLVNTVFNNNEALSGGAVGVKGIGTLDITTSTFTGNKATYAGGAVDIHYGDSPQPGRMGVSLVSSDVEVTLYGISTFSGNTVGEGFSTETNSGDVAYSRYSDDGDSAKIKYLDGGRPLASMDVPIHLDLEFADQDRTWLVNMEEPNPGKPGETEAVKNPKDIVEIAIDEATGAVTVIYNDGTEKPLNTTDRHFEISYPLEKFAPVQQSSAQPNTLVFEADGVIIPSGVLLKYTASVNTAASSDSVRANANESQTFYGFATMVDGKSVLNIDVSTLPSGIYDIAYESVNNNPTFSGQLAAGYAHTAAVGEKGDKGDKGDPGEQGADGRSGSSGGCDVGYAALALFSLVPLLMRRSK